MLHIKLVIIKKMILISQLGINKVYQSVCLSESSLLHLDNNLWCHCYSLNHKLLVYATRTTPKRVPFPLIFQFSHINMKCYLEEFRQEGLVTSLTSSANSIRPLETFWKGHHSREGKSVSNLLRSVSLRAVCTDDMFGETCENLSDTCACNRSIIAVISWSGCSAAAAKLYF